LEGGVDLREARGVVCVEEVGGGVSQRKCEEVESRVKLGNPALIVLLKYLNELGESGKHFQASPSKPP
jgi:hypothetical protein